MEKKPRITCLPNGPYSVEGDVGLAVSGKAFLCRCGGSAKKPFCDGTHRNNGFRDANEADPKKNRRRAYGGKGITIFDNRAVCSHAAHCTEELASVFRHHDNPWIDPDGASVQRIIAQIEKCPSGALSYAIEGIEASPRERPPKVTVTDSGPYAITGGVELVNIKFGDGAPTEHYTLCRCGASKNKPFCDGTHWAVSFRDP
jgi:CDGSH-type Zn-finger protein